MSGVGKGVASSSIGLLLRSKGLRVTAIKIDPYINVDAGTMNPTEHGEVFVLDDGDETDQDMGNYERFLDESLTRDNYMTTGRVYQEVIRKERNLEYKGKNVEVVPDVPLEIIGRIKRAASKAKADVTLIEIGGTVGEYQNVLFVEAARMMKIESPDDVAFVMVSYLPIPSKIGEMKTKPTQHAVRTLNNAGVQADIIIARSEASLDDKRKEKLALFCNIPAERIISAPDVTSIYDVPINFEKAGLGRVLMKVLRIPGQHKSDLRRWSAFVKKSKNGLKPVKIAVVGKYFDSGAFTLSDVYISVLEALKFSAYASNAHLDLHYINSKDFENGKHNVSILKKYDGILVPGGFGEKGVEGIIKAIEFARKKKVPYFGLCYGMQLAVVEYARHVLKYKDANTTEIDPHTHHPVIDVMHEQKELIANSRLGGTMRLGSYKAKLKPGTIAAKAYGEKIISERHRHRYEVNPEYVDKFENAGLIFSGKSPDEKLCEIAELPVSEHPFFVGTQFHPEFLARPLTPHPLFTAFIKAAVKNRR